MNKTVKDFALYGAIVMAIAVVLGALGAHTLKGMLSQEMLVVYHTGLEYQFYHAFGLFCVAFVASFSDSKWVKVSGYTMIFGTVIFSGSLYILALTGIKLFGAATPIGGTAFIVAWVLLALSIKKA